MLLPVHPSQPWGSLRPPQKSPNVDLYVDIALRIITQYLGMVTSRLESPFGNAPRTVALPTRNHPFTMGLLHGATAPALYFARGMQRRYSRRADSVEGWSASVPPRLRVETLNVDVGNVELHPKPVPKARPLRGYLRPAFRCFTAHPRFKPFVSRPG